MDGFSSLIVLQGLGLMAISGVAVLMYFFGYAQLVIKRKR